MSVSVLVLYVKSIGFLAAGTARAVASVYCLHKVVRGYSRQDGNRGWLYACLGWDVTGWESRFAARRSAVVEALFDGLGWVP